MNNTSHGKAFEYALAAAFSQITKVNILENQALETAKKCYELLDLSHRNLLQKSSDEAALFLSAHDTKIQKARSIMLQNDAIGIQGDVRDIVIEVPISQQVGISAKHNHNAVKHSRLSDKIDFGKEWADYPCSEKYFKAVNPIFSQLREMKAQKMFFKEIQGKEGRIYLPVLIAFEDELKRLCENFRSIFVERFFRYLLGRHDFYKVILNNKDKSKEVVIQSVNIGGTLDYGKKWKIPNRIHSINRKRYSSSTIEVIFDGGWNISFRLHNASSKVEPSLKFDIQFIGLPNSVSSHQIKI
ncbi:MAG: HaeIII family restriction endonuclease [Endomicrobium sp.]|jgi:hypothetical protein|nr:HaeIII family restriction endonuclease [Endomicrobium sp.]